MTIINKKYGGTKTGANIRIDWNTKMLCLIRRLYYGESAIN